MMILIYPGAFDADRLETMLSCLKDYEIRLLNDEDLKTPMGNLLAADRSDGDAGSDCRRKAPFLYLSGLNRAQISKLQSDLESAGLPVRSMAVETPDNRAFTLEELMDEVEREAAYFEKRDELADLLMHADRARMQSDRDYFQCCMMAASLLQEEELSETMLDTALQILHSFDRP